MCSWNTNHSTVLGRKATHVCKRRMGTKSQAERNAESTSVGRSSSRYSQCSQTWCRRDLHHFLESVGFFCRTNSQSLQLRLPKPETKRQKGLFVFVDKCGTCNWKRNWIPILC